MAVVFQSEIIKRLQKRYYTFTSNSIRLMLDSYMSRMIKELSKDEHIFVNGRTRGGRWNGFIIMEDIRGNRYISKMIDRKRKKGIRKRVNKFRHAKKESSK